MAGGIERTCTACRKKNRVLYRRLGDQARCGAYGAALPPPAEPVAVDTGGELDLVLHEAALPVLVDFWAP